MSGESVGAARKAALDAVETVAREAESLAYLLDNFNGWDNHGDLLGIRQAMSRLNAANIEARRRVFTFGGKAAQEWTTSPGSTDA